VSFDLGWKFHLGDVTGAQASTFDDAGWQSIDVPHDWSISLPFNQSSKATYEGGYLDGGVGWYRKSFAVPAAGVGQKIDLQFDGVYMDSTVWLNGTQVCAFECDVTVMDEAFGCWYNGKHTYDYGRFFRQWANTDIEDMVARDMNHPSVFVWSIANEVGETSDSTTVRQLMDAIKAVDKSRPVACPLGGGGYRRSRLGGHRGCQLRPGTVRLPAHGSPDVEDVWQRDRVRSEQPRDLQHREHAVLVL